MLNSIFPAALQDFFKGAIDVIWKSHKRLFEEEQYIHKRPCSGELPCAQSQASFDHYHRSMQMNPKQKHKPINSHKKVPCVIITVFPLGAFGPESPTSRLSLLQHFTLIHLLDHTMPNSQERLIPPKSLHIQTTGPVFLMADGAWNALRFPHPGMRCSALTTGKKHRPGLPHGQLDHGSWGPPWPVSLTRQHSHAPCCVFLILCLSSSILLRAHFLLHSIQQLLSGE